MLSDLHLYKSNVFFFFFLNLKIQIALIIDYGEELSRLILPSKS